MQTILIIIVIKALNFDMQKTHSKNYQIAQCLIHESVISLKKLRRYDQLCVHNISLVTHT